MFNLRKEEEEKLLEITKAYLEQTGESIEGVEFKVHYGNKYVSVTTKNQMGYQRTRVHYEPKTDVLYANMGDQTYIVSARPSTKVVLEKAEIRQ